ncbi:MAG: DUF4373 domain-containing protein [Clostridia bacterium]|jgi:hypothetical protein|nr:DUF4373 domain-containing protein [Clostridia bacterium]
MAAPIKTGLDYFPFDVDLLSDRKLRRCKLKYGYTATMIYIALLSILYKDKGYYIDYSDRHKDDVVWEVLEYMQGKYQPAAETVTEVIEDLVACELFSGDQFKSKTITSIRAQKIYYRSTVDRKAVDIDFDKWLLSEDEMKAISEKSVILRNFINWTNNPINRANNEVNQSINPQSKVKESKVNKSKEICADAPPRTRTKRFVQPAAEEVQVYCSERKNGIDAQRFIDYYTSNGWMVGKNPMKDWKAAVRTWERNGISGTSSGTAKPKQNSFNSYSQRQYDYAAIEKKIREEM